ncbi:class I tRNA ligase family protein, partial [Candidatus Dojkabacteria bacterium]|nr:class I tRNA ligase family protein [Candidatus Dojkabacteria bacterium]
VGLNKWEDNPYEGMFYKKANKYITADLVERNLLFKDDKITHRFPYHDRCDTPLVYKAQKSWFIKVEALKKRMLELNKDINWVPKHLQDGRFGKGIEQAPDWCISRSRYWATPMPVWRSKDGETIVVSSVKELEELSGQKVEDLHRPYIDEITIEKDGKVYTRIPEVLDCWMESGSMPFAQVHYPFENEKKFEENYPGDYIVEYIAQTRAWFYVMHVMSTALFDSISFKNVVTTGVMSGNDGRKMSKTYGNYTDPKELLETIGGDALRLFLMGSPLMVGENANFDEGEIRNKVKNVLNPLWNSLKFFLIYAEMYNWDGTKLVESKNDLDKWINVRLDQTLLEFSSSIEKYEMPSAVRPVEDFVTDLSTWYVRRSRGRFAKGDAEALSTLYSVLLKFSKGVAPLIPFITESIYQELALAKNKKESVHLEDYPEIKKLTAKDEALLEEMNLIRNLCNAGQALRVESELKVKQPLNSLLIKGDIKLESWMTELIGDELNVKVVRKFESSDKTKTMPSIKVFELTVYLDTDLDEKLKEEGMVRELTRLIQASRKENGFQLGDLVDLQYSTSSNELKSVLRDYEDELKSATGLKTVTENILDSKEERVGEYLIKLTTVKPT